MSSTIKANEAEQKELYDIASTIPFDDRMNHEASINDLKLALKNNGSKEPVFETNETRDYFITTLYIHEGFQDE